MLIKKLRVLSAWGVRHVLAPLLLGAGVALLLPPWQEYDLALIAGLWLVYGVAEGRLWPATPFNLVTGWLMLMSLVAWHFTPDPLAARLVVGRLWAGLGLAYGVMIWAKTPRHLAQLEALSALGGLALVAAGMVGIHWSLGKLPWIPRTVYAALPVQAQGFFNANMLAGALVVLLPLPLASALWAHGPWRWLTRVGYVLVILVMLGMLLLTQSRGAWLAALAALALVLIARWPRLIWVLWPVAIGVAWYVAHIGLESVLQAPVTDTMISGWRSRVELWQRALAMLRDFPLTGVGPGLFERWLWVLYPPLTIAPTASPGLHAHNIFLQMVVDFGVPGMLAFVAFLLGSVVWSIPAARYTELRAAVWGGWGALVALFVHGLVDAPWLVGRSAFALWWALGILLGAANLAAQRALASQ